MRRVPSMLRGSQNPVKPFSKVVRVSSTRTLSLVWFTICTDVGRGQLACAGRQRVVEAVVGFGDGRGHRQVEAVVRDLETELVVARGHDQLVGSNRRH